MKSVIRAEAAIRGPLVWNSIILYALACICVSSMTEINALSGNIIGYIYTYVDIRIVKNERVYQLIFQCFLIMHLSLLLESDL